MKRTVTPVFLSLCAFLACTESVQDFHDRAYVADTHNDVLLRVMRGEDITQWTSSGHSDIPRLLAGGVDVQVFSVWINPSFFPLDSSFEQANAEIDALYELEGKAPGKFEMAKTYDDLLAIEETGKLAAVIGVEGGHHIENSLENLEHLFNRGMRYLTLTWNNSTTWATSARDEAEEEDLPFLGLTDFGREIVQTCNDLGVIVDVSHVGERTFWDIMQTTSKPVIASHSSAYALCPHYRNLKDDQLLAVKENGGVVFVNFYPSFIDSTFSARADQVEEDYANELDSLRALYDEDSDDFWGARIEVLEEPLAKVAPPIDILIDHIDHIVRLTGADHVGLGSDFDGISVPPQGLEDCTKFPAITEKLLDRGYSKSDVRKILGENFKRVFKEVVG
ncbi:MAG: dipeptidase [Candidatus Neomarinimicrobiota bacterium]